MAAERDDKKGDATPRTDAALEHERKSSRIFRPGVLLELCRELERELTVARSAVAALSDDEITRLIATAAQHLRTWATSTNKEPYRNTMEVALRLDALVAQLGSAPRSATASMTDRDAARYRWLRHTHLGELLALFHTTDMSDVGLDFIIDEAIERRKELKLDAPNIELGPMP